MDPDPRTSSQQGGLDTPWARAQALIAEVHHAAVADALAFLEREIVAARVGAKGPQGAVAQVAVPVPSRPRSTNDAHLRTREVISHNAADEGNHGIHLRFAYLCHCEAHLLSRTALGW